MDIPSEINAIEEADRLDKKTVEPSRFQGEIEFRNVWFRYPTRKHDWVLKGLNMKINKNETVALVGESGCGKSTIVSLILRFYDVDQGEILIDGVNVKDWNIVSLRKSMGLVMQEPTLFNYTIAENILYGQADASNSQIYDSTRITNALEFIESTSIENAFDDSERTIS
jgi:ABC-type multidrug transport system fused ATPase/permease subunit